MLAGKCEWRLKEIGTHTRLPLQLILLDYQWWKAPNSVYVYNTVAHSLKARIVESQQPTVTRQRPINNSSDFCAVRADGCVRNNRIRHATAKQQLHCNRGMVCSMRSVSRCYKQDS
jgi:hypothetical protein